jgi:hypothetical protein
MIASRVIDQLAWKPADDIFLIRLSRFERKVTERAPTTISSAKHNPRRRQPPLQEIGGWR